jgi:Leucine-rich repeat (LRR) protein
MADTQGSDLLTYQEALERFGNISLTDKGELQLLSRSFSAVGAKYFAPQYKYLTEALLQLCSDKGVDFTSIVTALTILGKNSSFIDDYTKKESLAFLPLDSILTYIHARELQEEGKLQDAYQTYISNQILDSLDRAMAINQQLNQQTPTPTSTPTLSPTYVPTPTPTQTPTPTTDPTAFSYQDIGINSISITGYSGDDNVIVIPSSIDGKTVTEIGDSAFLGKNAYRVVLPSSIVHLAWGAFHSCQNLHEITLPENLQIIDRCAFLSTAIEQIEIPASVTKIDTDVFSYCSNLKAISVSLKNKAYTSVDGVLFSKDMTELICIPPTKTGRYDVPSGVTKIIEGAFSFSQLAEINMPASIEEINSFAFTGCSTLEAIFMDNQTTANGNQLSVVDGVLYSKDKDVLEYYPEGKTDHEFDIPEGVTQISGNALFITNTYLTSVVIPDTLIIDRNCFSECENLEEIKVSYTNPRYMSVDGVLFSKDIKTLFSYPAEKANQNYMVPYTVQTIADDAFCNAKRLESLTLQEGLSVIGSLAFTSCSGLREMNFPNSLEEIGFCAFQGEMMRQPFRLTIPAGVTKIDFNSCWGWGDTSKLIIVCSEGSAAYQYAVEHGITHEELSSSPATTPALSATSGAMQTQAPSLKGIVFNDANLEVEIRDILGMPEEAITIEDVSSIDSLDLNGKGIANIDALVYFSNLTSLDLGDNRISDISALSSLTSLNSLTAYSNQIQDLSPLSGLTALGYLCMSDNDIGEIDALAGLNSLWGLQLNSNHISNIDVLCQLHSLTYVTFDDNKISELNALSDLTGMTTLSLMNNQISNVDALADLDNLTYLNLWGNNVSDISVLANMSLLETLYLTDNPIVDYSPLIKLEKLTDCDVAEKIAESAYTDASLFEYKVNNKKVTITGYIGTEADVIIPAQIDGYPVTTIGKEAFQDNDILTSVVVPEGVTTLEERSFGWCSNLTSITLPTTLKVIDDYALSTTSIASLDIPVNVSSIGEGVFFQCSCIAMLTVSANNPYFCVDHNALLDIKKTRLIVCADLSTALEYRVPATVTSIDAYAFENCSNLTSIVLPEGLKKVGDKCFADTSIVNLHIPASLKSIGWVAFENATQLQAITVAAGSKNFRGDNGGLVDLSTHTLLCIPYNYQQDTYTVANDVTTIGDNAVFLYSTQYYQSTLREVVLPINVKKIKCAGFNFFNFDKPFSIVIMNNKISFENENALLVDSSPDVTIFCYDNSSAMKYAKNCALTYTLNCTP